MKRAVFEGRKGAREKEKRDGGSPSHEIKFISSYQDIVREDNKQCEGPAVGAVRPEATCQNEFFAHSYLQAMAWSYT